MVDFFNKFYELEMKICCKRSKKIEVEDRIQKTDGEDEETVLDFLGAFGLYDHERFDRVLCQLWLPTLELRCLYPLQLPRSVFK